MVTFLLPVVLLEVLPAILPGFPPALPFEVAELFQDEGSPEPSPEPEETSGFRIPTYYLLILFLVAAIVVALLVARRWQIARNATFLAQQAPAPPPGDMPYADTGPHDAYPDAPPPVYDDGQGEQRVERDYRDYEQYQTRLY